LPAQKKHPSARRRRNVAASASTLSREHDLKVPDLPDRDTGWHEMTGEWWVDIWSSPMSPEWDDSDIHGVFILAAIYDDIWRGASAKDRKDAAAEFRLQRKDFGLTPYDRRRLEWTIEQADEAQSKGRKRRSEPEREPAPQPGSDDPRAVLRVV
jgi:hypothetical protein